MIISTSEIQEKVRRRYADAATSIDPSCCDSSYSEAGASDAFKASDPEKFGTKLYAAGDLSEIPNGAALASLGCGNPTAVAELKQGETVLDLGSGAGIDVLLSAKRVGPDGFVYGIDMTDEMLALARKHQEEAGASNVEFRKGVIEDIPLDDATVDVVISNCVINLSGDKPTVLSEMFRVLKPGGRIGITDVVSDDDLSGADRLERGSWLGCIAGALSFGEFRRGLEDVGFTDVSIEPTHSVADDMYSAIIKASKPGYKEVIDVAPLAD
ncbi:MAG: arsenite methyltransferase [Actinomycetota bacterium]|nr:arsenite methyltransferase [Actinomycetota bacterium]MDK1037923.1 arsenite methyltransferase [Actinomycetota bacterium]MDK1102710.1 arsenite methyltransferase [Actinomycetota bacterium]MDK1291597.1 arsenite methyltransferase [Actinomycetota bacterium]